MATKTFDFTKSMYLVGWDSATNPKNELFRFKNDGLRIKRTRIGETNELYGKTVTPVSGTTVTGGSGSTDWDRGIITKLQGTTNQAIEIAMGSGNEFFLRRLKVYMERQSEAETFGTVIAEVNGDTTLDVQLISDSSSEDDTLYFRPSYTEGVWTVKVILTFAGTSLNADEVRIADVQAYQSEYLIPFQYIQHNDYLETATLSALSATVVEPSTATVRIIMTKDDELYYYDGGDWVSCGTDTTRYDEFSNTIADANTNISTLITGSDEAKIGVIVVLLPTETDTPAISDLTLTT